MMHELSIALSILDTASQAASEQDGNVVAIHLKLGTFSGVVKESLLSAWLLARENSPFEDAELLITEVDASAYCPTCGTERGIVSMQQFCCSQCNTPLSKLIRGRELELTALEIDS